MCFSSCFLVFRHFLQKSLFQGLETYGIQNHEDANDFCNVLAWDLEQAIFDKFKPGPGESVSSEYREKVRLEVLTTLTAL
jgi:hypothetical protein